MNNDKIKELLIATKNFLSIDNWAQGQARLYNMQTKKFCYCITSAVMHVYDSNYDQYRGIFNDTIILLDNKATELFIDRLSTDQYFRPSVKVNDELGYQAIINLLDETICSLT